MKLPEKKYEPKHNNELGEYAQGWNSIITLAEFSCRCYSNEYTKELLLREKEYAYTQIMTIPYYNGRYDCILELEKLNEEVAAEDRLDNSFKDSFEALDISSIRDKLKKAVLVIDEPKSCSECMLSRVCYDTKNHRWYSTTCGLTEQKVDGDEAEEHRHKDCPLKTLPKKKDYSGFYMQGYSEYEDRYCEGFNECIDEILGEE